MSVFKLPKGDQTVLTIIVVINNVTLNVYFKIAKGQTNMPKDNQQFFDVAIII